MAAFLLSLREGLEAALIIGILLGALQRLGRRDLARYIWSGVGSAIVVSLALAAALTAAGIEFEGSTEQLFEAVTLLLAAAMLTGMIFWMKSQGARITQRLQAEVAQAARLAPVGTPAEAPTGRGVGGWSLFLVAFLAVVREGVELALLLTAAGFGTSLGSLVLGTGLGLACAAVTGSLLYAGVIRLDLKRFFGVTNVLLLIFAAGMVGLGMHELVEAGIAPAIVAPVWNLNPVLDEKSIVGQVLKTLLGYNGNPALIEVIAYAGYLLLVGFSLRRSPQRRVVAPAT